MDADVDPRSLWCAGVLGGGEVDPVAALDRWGVDSLLDSIRSEGVLNLVHARIGEMAAPGKAPLLAALAAPARLNAARSLLCISEAREIQQTLQAAGIPCLWLKGLALGQWLYAKPYLRELADLDLLLPDHGAALRAAEVLAPLGYVLPNPHIAGDLVVHQLTAWSSRAQLELDLHWDVSNSALFAGRLAWSPLSQRAISLPHLGNGARGLSELDAFLHACLHRAANALSRRENRLRWLYDIHLLAMRFDADEWPRVVEAARRAAAADATASALHACQRLLATQVPAAVLQVLRAVASGERVRTERLRSWSYFQRATWNRLPGLPTRLRWLRQLLLPDMAHMRVRYEVSRAGWLGVITQRLRHGWQRWLGYVKG